MICYNKKMATTRILFDTNIIIKREDPNILPADFIELNRIINDLNYKIFIHPLSIMDINRDKDEKRKNISLSKIATYSKIENYPDYSKDTGFKDIVGNEHKDNDRVDNSLIYSVYKNATDILITEDKGILLKAQNLNIKDKVLNISEAILYFSKFIPLQDQTLLSCFKKDNGWNIDLNDSIFDTLKNEYPDFADWWQRSVCKTMRDVYVYYSENSHDKGKIKAILVLKEEDKELLDSEPQIILEDVLKICLFKVDESTRGLKLGERLLKMAFEYAKLKNKTKLYLTHFTTGQNDKLISLIETYGFYFLTKKKNNEDVFYKEIKPSISPIIKTLENVKDNNQKYFPSFYDNLLVSKYIIPIKPAFFERLFPDMQKKEDSQYSQLSLDLNIKKDTKYTSEGFSIQKAYICNTNVASMKENDIVLFYRTNDYQSILTLGTIEKVYYNINDADEIYKLIKRRTVYTINEIKEKCGRSKAPVVILFKHNLNFNNEVKYDTLLSQEIIKGSIQTIREIKEHNTYKKIIQGNIDESLIIN